MVRSLIALFSLYLTSHLLVPALGQAIHEGGAAWTVIPTYNPSVHEIWMLGVSDLDSWSSVKGSPISTSSGWWSCRQALRLEPGDYVLTDFTIRVRYWYDTTALINNSDYLEAGIAKADGVTLTPYADTVMDLTASLNTLQPTAATPKDFICSTHYAGYESAGYSFTVDEGDDVYFYLAMHVQAVGSDPWVEGTERTGQYVPAINSSDSGHGETVEVARIVTAALGPVPWSSLDYTNGGADYLTGQTIQDITLTTNNKIVLEQGTAASPFYTSSDDSKTIAIPWVTDDDYWVIFEAVELNDTDVLTVQFQTLANDGLATNRWTLEIDMGATDHIDFGPTGSTAQSNLMNGIETDCDLTIGINVRPSVGRIDAFYMDTTIGAGAESDVATASFDTGTGDGVVVADVAIFSSGWASNGYYIIDDDTFNKYYITGYTSGTEVSVQGNPSAEAGSFTVYSRRDRAIISQYAKANSTRGEYTSSYDPCSITVSDPSDAIVIDTVYVVRDPLVIIGDSQCSTGYLSSKLAAEWTVPQFQWELNNGGVWVAYTVTDYATGMRYRFLHDTPGLGDAGEMVGVVHVYAAAGTNDCLNQTGAPERAATVLSAVAYMAGYAKDIGSEFFVIGGPSLDASSTASEADAACMEQLNAGLEGVAKAILGSYYSPFDLINSDPATYMTDYHLTAAGAEVVARHAVRIYEAGVAQPSGEEGVGALHYRVNP